MLESLGDIIECPICLETMASPIRQCKNGHSICDGCASRINRCPLCKSPITKARNYQLEKVIANLTEIAIYDAPCKYAKKGCKIKPNKDDENHELECKHREYICEGKRFANWNCGWKGDHEHIFQHFKTDHTKHTWMEFQTSVHLKVDLTREFLDIQIIPYNASEELFWYKHKIEVEREKAYWLFQYVGPTSEANKYFYEFTIRHGPLRIIKVREICEGDSKDVTEIIDSGKCVCIPFNILRSYLTKDQEITFTFKIGEVKEGFENASKQNVKQFISNVCNNNSVNRQVPPSNTNTMQGQQIHYQPGYGSNSIQSNLNFPFPFQFSGPHNFQYPGMPPSVQFAGPYNPGFPGVLPPLAPQFMQYPQQSFVRPDAYHQQQYPKK